MSGGPFLLGLTGSIGMGKSTVAGMFTDAGAPVFDADAAVHRLQAPGGALVETIETAFPGTTGPEGVNRAALGDAVLGSTDALRRLEAIVHPAVRAERAAFVTANASTCLLVFDVPLLFETGGERQVSAVAVVSAPPDVQRARVLARAGMTPERLDAILARQMPDEEKRARATYIIDTGTGLDATRAAVRRLVACLSAPQRR